MERHSSSGFVKEHASADRDAISVPTSRPLALRDALTAMMRNSDAAKNVAKLSASARLCNGRFGAFSRTTFAIFFSRSVVIWIDIPQTRQRELD
jgi:hypothetical protein